MPPVTLDHCVIHVTDWEGSNTFYTTVLGAQLIVRPVGFAYRFGDRQLNVHGPGVAPAEVARFPVAPGNSDLCFEWNGPIAEVIDHLFRCGVAVEAGPTQRFGAKGAGASVCFRDPDGSLMEFISYVPQTELNRWPCAKHPAGTIRLSCRPAFRCRGTTAARVILSALKAARSGAAGNPQRLLESVGPVWPHRSLHIPRTGVPGVDLPPGWDDIPGARGCTPQSCSFRDHFAELESLGSGSCLRPLDPGYRLSTRSRRAAPLAVPDPVRCGIEVYRGPEGANICRRRHDAAQAHGAFVDDGIISKSLLPRIPARQERGGGHGLAAAQSMLKALCHLNSKISWRTGTLHAARHAVCDVCDRPAKDQGRKRYVALEAD